MKTLKRKIADAFIPKGTISKAAYIILAVLSFALIFAVWMYAVYVKGIDGMFLPSPEKTLESAKNMFAGGGYLTDIRNVRPACADRISDFSSCGNPAGTADRYLCSDCSIF